MSDKPLISIVHINKFFCPIGGAEKIMMHEAELFSEKGHEIYFFASDRKPYFIEDYKYSSYFAKYTPYSKLPAIEAIKNIPKMIYDTGVERKLDYFLKKFNPDVVHIHEFFYNLTPSIINACKKNNIPVVMTLHTARLVCPTGKVMLGGKTFCEEVYCARGNSFHCIANNCFEGNLKQSAVYALEFACRKAHKALEKIDHFISPSQALAQLAVKSGIVGGKISVLNNFLEHRSLDVKPRYEGENYFLYVGRLGYDKGVNFLIEAFRHLPKEIELHIVGTGPQEEEFKKMAGSYGLDNVKFMGFKSGNDLQEEYRNCIASTLPCNWFEAFGVVIIEAFAFGKPVVASHMGAIPEIIENDITGCTVEAANPKVIAQALEKLFYDRGKAAIMGKNARKKAEEQYNPDLHYKKLLEVYNTVL